MNDNNGNTRLSKFLSDAGIASRRKADEMIASGLVSINDDIVTEAWRRVQPGDKVLVNGRQVRSKTGRTYVMFNKPPGVVCTCADEYAETTLTDIVKVRGARLFPVGRLDKDSEGLLLLTDDGEFANRMTHPRYGTTKTYTVHTDVALGGESIRVLLKGFRDQGEFIKAERIIRKAEKLYIFIMKEGKKREIRRLVKRAGANIRRLRRTAVGGLQLDKRLPIGKWRHLTRAEIEFLNSSGKQENH
jgi:pseudouridine synthase